MKVTWFLTAVLATALAAPEEKRQDSDSVNWSALGQALKSHTLSMPTKTANLDNISPPPRSLIPEIIHNVPPTVLAQLMVPAQRSSIASEFQAGRTPSWYNSLPTDVKSYLHAVKKQMSDGALTASPTPTSSSAKDGSAQAASSTSSGVGAAGAQPTGGLVMGGLGALGVLGVAVAL
ncbi:hypothetical protein BDV25DRAFT_168847 [Aspergillus avenaceus]|uniref:Uncharacterized protein n=1 Tax=Aspergillus avenaceus TaxID=36643 RepID=A0A5N6TN74_ASPAV|nr:hypothetical protein BDV25DRAFT_168847 [Aspergillus avenaceus]